MGPLGRGVAIGVGAPALILGGFAAGLARGHSDSVVTVQQESASAGTYDALDGAIAFTTGLDVAKLHSLPGYSRTPLSPCGSGRCLRVYSPVSGVSGQAMQTRLYKAGWLLVPEQQPECVADNPPVFGVVCSYEQGNIVVSVQVEQPQSGYLLVWATSFGR